MPTSKENVRFLVPSDLEPGHPLKLGCCLWRYHVDETVVRIMWKDGRTIQAATRTVLWGWWEQRQAAQGY